MNPEDSQKTLLRLAGIQVALVVASFLAIVAVLFQRNLFFMLGYGVYEAAAFILSILGFFFVTMQRKGKMSRGYLILIPLLIEAYISMTVFTYFFLITRGFLSQGQNVLKPEFMFGLINFVLFASLLISHFYILYVTRRELRLIKR